MTDCRKEMPFLSHITSFPLTQLVILPKISSSVRPVCVCKHNHFDAAAAAVIEEQKSGAKAEAMIERVLEMMAGGRKRKEGRKEIGEAAEQRIRTTQKT